MLIDVQCPKCNDRIPVTESAGDQTIDCPGCGKRFTVPAASAAAGPSPAERPKSSNSREKKPTGRSRRHREDEDDDDNDRFQREAEDSGGGMIGIIVAGGIGLLVLAGGFGLVVWLIFSGNKQAAVNAPDDNRAETRNDAAIPVAPKGNRTTEVDRPRPAPPPPAGPPAAVAAPFVQLPATAGNACVGGGGRFLVLHLKATRQVAVVDLPAKKIAGYIPAASDDVMLTAGMNHVVLGFPKQKLLQRYSLATLEKDQSVPMPTEWPLRGLGMGMASNGPLMVVAGEFGRGRDVFLIDVLTMQRAPGSDVQPVDFWPDATSRVWASLDGRTFSSRGFGAASVFQIRPSGWAVSRSPCDPPILGADGESVYGNGQIARAGGELVGERKHGVYYLPAAEGPFYLSLGEQKLGVWPNERKYTEVQVHTGQSVGPVCTYPELPETQGFIDPFQEPHKGLDRHIFYLPFSKVMAILPAARDRVCLRSINLKNNLENAPADYLLVVSRPPAAIRGQTFRYAPDVWSKRGGVKITFDAGPPGMMVQAGAVVWPVPADFAEASVNVILSVTDSSGQSTFHTFDLPVFAAR